jgi:hypothetical protein
VCDEYRSDEGGINEDYVTKHAAKVRKAIKDLVRHGIYKFGFQLSIVEVTSVSSILMLKLIIDCLKSPEDYSLGYKIMIFVVFTLLRLTSIFARSYYDLDVYNYFRYAQTKMQVWLFDLTCDLR